MVKPVKIDVQKLQQGAEIIVLDHSPKYFDLADGEDYEILGRIKGQVTFSLLQDKVLMEGNLDATFRMDCIRCLKKVEIPIQKSFSMFFIKKQEDYVEDSAVDPDEEDVGFFKGKFIHPDNDIRELLLIDLPDYPLCGDECRGLCPGCGANLNKEPCRCAPEQKPDEGAMEEKASDWKEKIKTILN